MTFFLLIIDGQLKCSLIPDVWQSSYDKVYLEAICQNVSVANSKADWIFSMNSAAWIEKDM